MTAFLFSQEISCNNLLTTSDKAQILRPLADFATNMTNLAEVQKTLRDRRETKERNRTYILKKKARTAENLKGMVEKQKRNRTHSQEESKDCRKHERIEEEQKKKTEHILKKKANNCRKHGGIEEEQKENITSSPQRKQELQKTWRDRSGTQQSLQKKVRIAENEKR